jgi:hypothetical protein
MFMLGQIPKMTRLVEIPILMMKLMSLRMKIMSKTRMKILLPSMDLKQVGPGAIIMDPLMVMMMVIIIMMMMVQVIIIITQDVGVVAQVARLTQHVVLVIKNPGTMILSRSIIEVKAQRARP